MSCPIAAICMQTGTFARASRRSTAKHSRSTERYFPRPANLDDPARGISPRHLAHQSAVRRLSCMSDLHALSLATKLDEGVHHVPRLMTETEKAIHHTLPPGGQPSTPIMLPVRYAI